MRVEHNRLWFPLCAIGFGLALGVSGCAKRAITTQGAGQVAPPPAVEQAPAAPSEATPQSQPKVRERNLEEQSREQVSKEIAGGGPEAQPTQAAAAGLVRIHFGFDKYVLTPEAQGILKKNADWLRNNPNVKVLIDGNTDERGTEEYNLALGEKRAHAAKQYLEELGIPADRLSTISYGENRPLDPAHNEEAWAKNRRDGFHPMGQ